MASSGQHNQTSSLTLAIVLENAVVCLKAPPPQLDTLLMELSNADESYSKTRFTLVYMDDENEMVKIDTQADYETAIRYAEIEDIKCLELTIIQKTRDDRHGSGFSTLLTHSIRMGDYRVIGGANQSGQQYHMDQHNNLTSADRYSQ